VKKQGLSFDVVRDFALKLPDTEAGTAWRSPMLRVGGRIFAGIPVHKSAEPGSLMVRVDVADRDALIAEQPDIYYTAAHYENYSCVLVRLSRIRRDALEDLLRMAHRYTSARRQKPAKRKRPSRSPRRARATR
jgi:hypothetical protein